jgi:hypothetical protein
MSAKARKILTIKALALADVFGQSPGLMWFLENTFEIWPASDRGMPEAVRIPLFTKLSKRNDASSSLYGRFRTSTFPPHAPLLAEKCRATQITAQMMAPIHKR